MSNKGNGRILGIIAALITNIIFGFSFMFSKKALAFTHPLIIAAVRFTVAFITMNIQTLKKYKKMLTSVFLCDIIFGYPHGSSVINPFGTDTGVTSY